MTGSEQPARPPGATARGVLWAAATLAALGGAVLVAFTPQGSARLTALFDGSGQIAATLAAISGKSDRAEIEIEPTRSLPSLEARIMLLEQHVDELQRRLGRTGAVQAPTPTTILGKVQQDRDTVTGSVAATLEPRPVITTAVAPVLRPRAAPEPSPGSIEVTYAPLKPSTAPDDRSFANDFAAVGLDRSGSGGGQSQIRKTDFGIALGTAGDVGTLEAMWGKLAAAQPVALAGLEPRIAVDRSQPGGTRLQLIAGPVRNARDAARLCVTLAGMGQDCQTVPFNDDTLALRASR